MKRFFRRLVFWLPVSLCFHTALAEPLSSPTPQVVLTEPHAKILRLDPPPLPELSSQQFSGGVYDLLVDEQHLTAEKVTYHHYATYLAAEEGLQESSQIQVTYDPGFQNLKFHFAQIRRGTEMINCWDAAQVKLLQRENDMERHIFDGRVSAVLVLNGLRVGDVVEYAYSIEGRNPVFGDDFYLSFYTRWSRPVEQVFQRVVTPKSTAAAFQVHEGAAQPERKENAEEWEWIWAEKKVPSVLEEDQVPDWLDSYAWVEASSYRDWSQVNAWAQGLYQPKTEDPLPAELEAKLEEIRKRFDTPLLQAAAILRLVQEEIRYLGFEMGTGSYTPNPPALVWERRFGDCKDKSLILSILLRRVGLEANPSLVNTTYRGQITEWIPSPQAFDHAIVCARHDGKTFWLDPTRSGQRGPLEKIYIPDYQKSLVVEKGTTGLTPMLWSPPSLPLIEVEETFHSDNLEAPARYEIKTLYRSYEAERARIYFRSTSLEKIAQGYMEYYADQYPHLRRDTPVQMEDDPEKNEITIRERYLVEDFWQFSDNKKEKTADFDATMVRNKMTSAGTSNRSMPLEVSHPVFITQSTRIHLPSDWSITPEKLNLKNPAFEFFYEQKGKGKLVELDYKFKTLSNQVSASEVKEYGQKIAQAKESLGFWLSSPVTSSSDSSNPASPESSTFHPNWAILSVTALLAVGFSYLAFRLVQWKKDFHHPPCPPHLAQYEGLRGWLYLVGFGVVVRPIYMLFILFSSYGWMYSHEAWENLTSPASANYHVLWAPLLLGELVGNLALTATSIALVFLFFQRRRHFPEALASLMVFSMIFLWTDYAVATQLPLIDKATAKELLTDAGKATLQAAIWVPYLFVSKRVKATFRC